MKKSQRARLSILTAKEASTRTPEEAAEFTYLTALAALHPDLSKDIDDLSAAAATNAAPAAGASASPAAGASAPPTLKSVITGALSSLGDKTKLGADLAQARADLASRTTERDQARSELATANTQIDAFASFFGLKRADLAGKDAATLNALFAQKVSDSAVEQLATAGVPAAALPKATQADAKSPTDLLAEYNKITDPMARGEFYEKHKATMFGGSN